jgi:hypothetical protein
MALHGFGKAPPARKNALASDSVFGEVHACQSYDLPRFAGQPARPLWRVCSFWVFVLLIRPMSVAPVASRDKAWSGVTANCHSRSLTKH